MVCGCRVEHAVGADYLAACRVAHDQMFAVGIVGVAVEAAAGRLEARAHFAGEHLVAQALRFDHFALTLCDRHFEGGRLSRAIADQTLQHASSPVVNVRIS